ncbi:RHS repeat-associated protein [Pseudomonas sp. WPR_5_2]|uniref:RHS repeat-associated core domain-containing protein n=1 Tax=Pseudomonas sp. WPR_5_2 TaxID=1907371 RepID=UPI000EB3822A|nr:RHS repeat-associated core domain-containing protein [Pseudomonas sp. WPR_5_2]RKS21271.1 RHS repeat-associated protein [Pseudomonas sp. WPR_5_2]
MPNLPSVTQPRAILLAPDDKNSIHAELAGAQHNSIAYSPYGRQSAQQKIASHLGFNGELCERAIGWYFLGKGYRVYNPILMRFHSPDSWSPFGKGGGNAYAYCAGDPRNFTDPTGHMLRALKHFGKTRKTIAGASSTSSLSPLISDVAEVVSTVPSKTKSKTIPALTRETLTETVVSERHFIDYGSWRDTPLSIPPKQRPPVPRINDTGGQVIDSTWSSTNIWNKETFRFPTVPLPPIRTLPNGIEYRYSLNNVNESYPTLSRRELIDLHKQGRAIRTEKSRH